MVAAAIAATGGSVTLARTAPVLPASLTCVEGSTWRASATGSHVVQEVCGPTTPSQVPSMGLLASGRTLRLPLQPAEVTRILPAGHRRTVAKSFLRARARNTLATVVGGGQEERSYRDWVVRRMGEPAYTLLYADYAERRWGRSGGELSASLARVVHGIGGESQRVRPVDARDHGVVRAEAILNASGATILDTGVRRFHIDNATVASVELDDAFLDTTETTVWTTLPPARVAACLGPDCPSAARHLAPTLSTRSAARLRLSGASPSAPDEVHILDPAPCWRLVRAPDDPKHWVVSTYTGLSDALLEDVRDFAAQAGLIEAGGAVVAAAELPGGMSAWGRLDHARLRTVLDALRPLRLRLTGSAGTLSPLDPPDLVAHVCHLQDHGAESHQEAWRAIAAPPARADDLDARLSRFFAGV